MANRTDRQPRVSFVLATHNRREVLGSTLSRVAAGGLDSGDYEIIVVDNDSRDGSAAVIADAGAVGVRLARNTGSCAKAYGVDRARGTYIVFLDDDSHPHPGSIERMMAYFETDPRLGAAGFQVHLPNGGCEGGALPDVFVGCGVGFRAEALRACGGLDRTFFMQAEEYDLAFRLVSADWQVRVFDDLHVEHLKTEVARRSERTTYYNIRNNLRVLARYLPASHYAPYRADCLQRYAWLARRDGHTRAYRRGAAAGKLLGGIERIAYRRLAPDAIERFFRWSFIEARMAELAADGVARVTFADLGKNVYAYVRAAEATGVEVVAVGDDRFAADGRAYRGVPIVPLDESLSVDADAVVVANSSAVHGTESYRNLAGLTRRPVHHWFGPSEEPILTQSNEVEGKPAADRSVTEAALAVAV